MSTRYTERQRTICNVRYRGCRQLWYCIPSPRKKVLNLVGDLLDSHPDLRICFTSQPEQDIRMVLEPLACHHISLHDEGGQKDDIVNYVRFVVRSDRTMRRWRPEDKELVIRTLTERAN